MQVALRGVLGQGADGIGDALQTGIAAGGIAGELGEITGTQHDKEPRLIGFDRPLALRHLRQLFGISFRSEAEAGEGIVAQADVFGKLDLALEFILRGIEEKAAAGDECGPFLVVLGDATAGEFEHGAVSA